MTMTWVLNGWLKHAEQDVFGQGCIPETAQTSVIKVPISCDHGRKVLLDVVRRYFDVTDADIELDADAQAGRIDVRFYEDDEGAQVKDPANCKEWRTGNRRLWLCTYTSMLKQETAQSWAQSVG